MPGRIKSAGEENRRAEGGKGENEKRNERRRPVASDAGRNEKEGEDHLNE